MPFNYARRLERLRRLLRPEKVDALLVCSPTNVSYLTGFTGDSSYLFLSKERALIISDGRYTEQLRRECPSLEVHIRAVSQLLAPAAGGVIAGLGIGSLGFESASLSVDDYEELRVSVGSVLLKPVRNAVESLRMIKDREEIAAISTAIDQAERAFQSVRPTLRPEDSEKDIADNLEAALRRSGASSASFPTIVAVGAHAALPHHQPRSAARLLDGDFVLIDWGASGPVGYSYKSDLTRVLCTGKVTAKFEKVYRSVQKAQARAIASIRPGVKAGDVDGEARSVLDQDGLGRYFDHGLGHGLGLDIHESPRLRKDSDTVLSPGMVITVEPGVYLPGWGGVRLEDDVLITPEGCQVLTSLSRELEEARI